MNWLDLLLLVVIGVSVLAGFARGFARASFGLVSVVAGLLCALWFYPLAGAWLDRFVSSVQAANLLGFLLLFIGVMMLGGLLGKLLEKLLKLVHLSWLDRLLGAAFGLVRGVLVAAVIVLAIMAFSSKPPPASVTRSAVAPYVIDTARGLAAAAPHQVKEGFRQSYEKVKEIWANGVKKHVRKPADATI
jgi:membrane protein required for colicin V production